MTGFDTGPVRQSVVTDEDPFRAACAVIGSMVGIIEGRYGAAVALALLNGLQREVETSPLPPAPDHTITDL